MAEAPPSRGPLASFGHWWRRQINRELNQLSYNAQWLAGPGIPEVFQIELTNHCPMTCVMCPRTHAMSRPLGYMDVALFDRIGAQISSTSSRLFLHHFGDSLLHPQLGDILRLAARHGLATGLSANPILLTEARIRDLVDNGLEELVLSLDAVTPETSAAVRGKTARNVAQAEENVHALLSYRQRRGAATPRVIMQFVEHRANGHELAAWQAKWKAVGGLDRVKVKAFIGWNGGTESINALRPNDAPAVSGLVCDKPWTSVTVLWDGRVVPCCFDHDGSYILGDLRHQSLLEIYSGSALRALRQAHRDHELKGVTLCAHCVDKEGYPVRKAYYPLNRLFAATMPLGGGWEG